MKKTSRITLRMDPTLNEALRAAAAAQDRSVNWLACWILQDWVKHGGRLPQGVGHQLSKPQPSHRHL